MKGHWVALASGSLFAVGLSVGGMTDPAKVVGFLDVTGDWDPSLILVMLSAIAVYFPAFWWLSRRGVPAFAAQYLIPARRGIDARLVLGSVLFGIGWGLAGFCPGPALVQLGAGASPALVFVVAMLGGMWAHQWFELMLRRNQRPEVSGSAV